MRGHCVRWVVGLTVSLLCGAGPAFADLVLTKDAPDLALTEALRVSEISQWGRRAVNVDGVVQMMVDGTLGEPKAGDVVKRPEAMGGGERAWEEAKANEKGEFGGDGWVRGGAGSYVLCIVEAEEPRVMVLTGVGHSMVYVNGEPRVGDPYMHGYVRIPVALKKGRNQLLFAHAGRGMFKAKLETPKGDGGVEINTGDLTLPDALVGEGDGYAMGIPLVNCTDQPRSITIFADGPGDLEPAPGVNAVIAPLGIFKAAVSAAVRPTAGAQEVPVRVRIFNYDKGRFADRAPGPKERPILEQTITLRVREPDQVHKRTFISAIDGSVQYVAIVPPMKRAEEKESGRAEGQEHAPGSESWPIQTRPGLVLSLHGASVEAIRQAESYAPKEDIVIVCPTNRRPFGFDWEDWGRIDAIEAMDHARKWYDTDPSRQYLTGHSMGGHGTWQLGVLYPDRFAAIAPSAGWLSFESYAAARGDADKKPGHPAAEFFRRASASSDTVALMENLRGKGIYILHGDADDNVPVSEARKARAELDKLGIAYEFHEQPGAGHWWDDDKPGAACVDWGPLFEMFAKRSLSDRNVAREWSVRTTMQGVGYPVWGAGITIFEQDRRGLPSVVRARAIEDRKILSVTTENVRNMIMGPDVIWAPDLAGIEVDGATVKCEVPSNRVIILRKDDAAGWITPNHRTPHSRGFREPGTGGPFKNAIITRGALIYGVGGSKEEQAWAMSKARFDADQWWYRANGSVQVASESLLEKPSMPVGGSTFYGRPEPRRLTRQWFPPLARGLFETGPILLVHSLGADQAVLLATSSSIHTSPKVFITGTSLRAMRATDRLPYFLSGVGFPDVTVLDADVWSRGMKGVAGVGFFGPDWSVERGEFWWRDLPAK